MKKLFLVTIIAFLAVSMYGQTTGSDEVVLVPILVTQLPGAQGSVWSSVLRVHNRSDQLVSFGELRCVLSPCKVYGVPAHGSASPLTRPTGYSEEYPGTFLVVAGADLSVLDFNLRVFDESRLGENWGTTLPVVRWSDVIPATIDFPGVPVSSHFRDLVRVYALNGRGTTVTARYFDDESPGSDEILEQTVSFQTFYGNESYLELPPVDLRSFPAVRLLRIEIAADDPSLPFWAMVSITNNDTQVVTVYSSSDSPAAPN